MGVYNSSDAALEPRIIEKEVSLVLSVGAHIVNVFQITGAVRILNQWARITEVTRMDDLTGVYATYYNGTAQTDLTANGIALSNLGVGTYFTKDQLSAQTYSLVSGATGGMIETLQDRDAGRPFTVVQKATADSFIQLNVTAGTAEQEFKMYLFFKYILLNDGSNLEILI